MSWRGAKPCSGALPGRLKKKRGKSEKGGEKHVRTLIESSSLSNLNTWWSTAGFEVDLHGPPPPRPIYTATFPSLFHPQQPPDKSLSSSPSLSLFCFRSLAHSLAVSHAQLQLQLRKPDTDNIKKILPQSPPYRPGREQHTKPTKAFLPSSAVTPSPQ